MHHQSNRERHIQLVEIRERKSRDGKDIPPKARECFKRPPYYMQPSAK